MRALNRMLVRELTRTGPRLLSVVAVIAMGVACFVTLSTAYENLQRSKRDYYATCREADFWIKLKKAPDTATEDVEAIPGVREAQSRIVFGVTADLAGVDRPVSGLVVSLPEQRDRVINDVVIMRGGWFSAQRREEVIVNDAFAKAHGIAPGDTIHLIMNNRRQALLVVGTGISSEFTYLIEPGTIVPEPSLFGVFYVKRRFAEEAFDYDGACNQIVGLVSPGASGRVDEILSSAERSLDGYGVIDTTPRRDQQSHRLLTDEITELRTTAIVLPVVFLAAAALVLNVMMVRLAEQQRTVIGTLKAIGYTNARLFRHYAQHGLLVGLVGGIVGDGVGWVMAVGMTRMYRQFFEFPELRSGVYPWILIGGLLISAAFSVLGVMRGALNVTRLSPAEAMRPKAPVDGRRVWFERFGALWSRLGFRWRLVLRGVRRGRMRTVSGLFAAAVGAALIMVTLAFADAFGYLIDFQYGKVLQSDFDLSLKDERSGAAAIDMAGLPGVDRVEPLFEVACTFRHGRFEKKGAVTGLTRNAYLTVPRDLEGDPVPIPEVGLLMTRKLAEILHARPGDEITIVPVRGDRQPRRAPLVHVTDSYLGLSVYADFAYLNRLVGEEDAVSALQVRVDPSPAVRREFYRELKSIPIVQGVSPNAERKARLQRVFIQQLETTIGVLVAFSAILFMGSILSASLVSLSERRREIATLRVIGYTPGEVGGILLRENLLVYVSGAVLGIPLGYAMSLQLVRTYSTELFRVPLVIRPTSVIAPVLAAACFTAVSHLFIHRAIAKMDWLEALNVKE